MIWKIIFYSTLNTKCILCKYLRQGIKVETKGKQQNHIILPARDARRIFGYRESGDKSIFQEVDDQPFPYQHLYYVENSQQESIININISKCYLFILVYQKNDFPRIEQRLKIVNSYKKISNNVRKWGGLGRRPWILW